jgi:hypothetical protein
MMADCACPYARERGRGLPGMKDNGHVARGKRGGVTTAHGRIDRGGSLANGAEILNQVRRVSMPRASIAVTCRLQGRRRRWSVARSKRTTDAGQRRRRQILPSPLFTPVYGCSRNSVESQIVSRTGLPSGATSRYAYLWGISRSGDRMYSLGIRTLRETTDR